MPTRTTKSIILSTSYWKSATSKKIIRKCQMQHKMRMFSSSIAPAANAQRILDGLKISARRMIHVTCLEEGTDKLQEKESIEQEGNLTLLEKFQTLQKDEYLTVSILGPSNAGKSTLFNRLMCKESNKAYRLSSEKSSRRPNRSKVRHHVDCER